MTPSQFMNLDNNDIDYYHGNLNSVIHFHDFHYCYSFVHYLCSGYFYRYHHRHRELVGQSGHAGIRRHPG